MTHETKDFGPPAQELARKWMQTLRTHHPELDAGCGTIEAITLNACGMSVLSGMLTRMSLSTLQLCGFSGKQSGQVAIACFDGGSKMVHTTGFCPDGPLDVPFVVEAGPAKPPTIEECENAYHAAWVKVKHPHLPMSMVTFAERTGIEAERAGIAAVRALFVR